MELVTTADAVALVAAQRYGYHDVVDELLAQFEEWPRATGLAAQLGELTASIHGVILALAGHGDATLGLAELPDPDGIDELGMLAVRSAAEGDTEGLEVVCIEAYGEGLLGALLRHLVSGASRALGELDQLPGPDGNCVLARLGLAAAQRQH